MHTNQSETFNFRPVLTISSRLLIGGNKRKVLVKDKNQTMIVGKHASRFIEHPAIRVWLEGMGVAECAKIFSVIFLEDLNDAIPSENREIKSGQNEKSFELVSSLVTVVMESVFGTESQSYWPVDSLSTEDLVVGLSKLLMMIIMYGIVLTRIYLLNTIRDKFVIDVD